MKRLIVCGGAAGICMILAFGAGVIVGNERGIPFVGWEEGWFVGIYSGPSPFELQPDARISQPVLRGSDVTDCDAGFVADPFLVHDGGTWHMFVEVWNNETGEGDIGHATSANGLKWKWQSIVLDEPFHLSYPLVFRHDSQWYMIPETHRDNAVRLYRGDPFPTNWTPVADLLEGAYFDVTVFQHGEHWYMFTGEQYSIARLWVADDLFGPWREHPASPIHEHDDHYFRCAGRVIEHEGELYRFNQDVHGRYGNQVRAFHITKLSPTEYEEQQIDGNPLLIGTGQGEGWNCELMHHIDAHQLPDGTWIAVVDGFGRMKAFGLDY